VIIGSEGAKGKAHRAKKKNIRAIQIKLLFLEVLIPLNAHGRKSLKARGPTFGILAAGEMFY